ncbi:hypothetical protein [Klebsiella oxytoca]|uniref:hypothetical protein n=1 Tax=Klebsiella oxytoca TaxID=571 RepID=UPI0015C5F2D7|nr:hypothetical protein [Klebsiella oxytoca]
MGAFFHTLSRQRLFPEAMLRICPGYLPADDAEPVARARRFAPPPRAVCGAANFPEAMLRICPGYLPADNAEPVARARRFAPPPRAVCGAAEIPGGDAAHLSGLPARRQC